MKKDITDSNLVSKMLLAANLYYKDKMSQQEIAKKMNISRDRFIDSTIKIANLVKNVNGELVIAYHNDTFVDSSIWKGWSSAYEYTVRYASLLETNRIEEVEKMNL